MKNKNNLTKRLIEAKTTQSAISDKYSAAQLKNIEDIVKPLLDASELTTYNNMSSNEKGEYLSGFAENIKEWQNAKEQANDAQQGSQQGWQRGGQQGGQQPDDGLSHWKPASKSQNDNGQQMDNNDNAVFSDSEKELDDAEKEMQQAQQNASNAEDIADSAQQIADAAQKAADAAQAAADQANENAEISKSNQDIENADKAQAAADAAQKLADEAKQAANKAKQLADEAQKAADEGKTKEAGGKTHEAIEATQKAADKAAAAQMNAKNAIQAAKQTQQGQQSGQQGGQQSGQQGSQSGQQGGQQSGQQSGQQGGQHGSQSGQQSGQPGSQQGGQQGSQGNNIDNTPDPELQEVNDKFDPNGEVQHDKPFDTEINWGGNDFYGDSEEARQKFREIAERAGQPLDADDYQSPQEYAGKKYREAKGALSKWKPHGNPGNFGNKPDVLEEVFAKLFDSTFDWKTIVANFMTVEHPVDKEDIWAKRRMGVDNTHPFYIGRYQHPYEEDIDKPVGLAQVFFLVDASGSMWKVAGDGISIFDHIMSDLIQIELDAKVQRSAYAPFTTGSISRDDVIVWTWEDAQDEESLLEQFLLPKNPGGTSALDAIKSVQSFDDVYNMGNPQTLLIVVTDGEDYYNGLNEICEDPSQVDNMLWIITNDSESKFNEASKALQQQGVPDDHILFINILKEW